MISNEQENYIISLMYKYEKLTDAAMDFEATFKTPISTQTISKRWKSHKDYSSRDPEYTEFSEELAQKACSHCENNFNTMLGFTRFSTDRLSSICNEFNLKPKGMPRQIKNRYPNNSCKIGRINGKLNNRVRG